MSYSYKALILALCTSVCIINSRSALASSVPSSADPSRTLLGAHSKVLDFKKAEPAQSPVSSVPSNAPEGSEKVFFTLKAIKLDGMTAYADGQLSHIYSGDIGQKISVARLFEIMNAVQKRYLDDGYSLSRVTLPTQDIANGDVLLQVIEGFAGEVEFEGEVGQNPVLNDALKEIAFMRPLNTKKLERILLVLNDLPSFNVSAILGAVRSPTPVLGAIRLTLKQNPISRPLTTLGFNNYGSEFSGPFQLVASTKRPNTISVFDEFAATLSAAISTKEMKYAGLSYKRPILGVSGTNLTFDATIGRTAPGSTLQELDVRGRSESLKVGASYPLLRQRDKTFHVNTSFEMRQTQTNLLREELYNDSLRIFSLGATYNNADEYLGLNAFELTYSQGLNVFGIRNAGAENLSRSEGRPDFHKIYASAGRVQSLPYNLDLLLALQGQYSFDPLLSSEEFGFGGGQMGRGYDPSEVTGDKGIAATIELRSNLSCSALSAAIQSYVFYDFGKVWNTDPSSKNRESAASSGAGFRVAFSSGWSTDFTVALPLTRNSENPPKYINGQSPRILFSLQKKF